VSPVFKSMGCSDETPIKQATFGKILSILLRATKNHRRASWSHREFLYVDMNAGSGVYEDGSHGSPLIALGRARDMGEPIRAILYERDPETRDDCGGLVDNLYRLGFDAETHGDHGTADLDLRCVEKSLSGKPFGLIYADPNPDRDLVPAEVLTRIFKSSRLEMVDALVYVSATNYGRQRHYRERYLLDDLRAIGKRYVWLRRPAGPWRWTFAFLTNWDRWPGLAGDGFFRLGTPEGDALARDLNLTRKELGASAPLFGDAT